MVAWKQDICNHWKLIQRVWERNLGMDMSHNMCKPLSWKEYIEGDHMASLGRLGSILYTSIALLDPGRSLYGVVYGHDRLKSKPCSNEPGLGEVSREAAVNQMAPQIQICKCRRRFHQTRLLIKWLHLSVSNVRQSAVVCIEVLARE